MLMLIFAASFVLSPLLELLFIDFAMPLFSALFIADVVRHAADAYAITLAPFRYILRH